MNLAVSVRVLNAAGDAVDSATLDAIVVPAGATRFATFNPVISSGDILRAVQPGRHRGRTTTTNSGCGKIHMSFDLVACQVTPTVTTRRPTRRSRRR